NGPQVLILYSGALDDRPCATGPVQRLVKDRVADFDVVSAVPLFRTGRRGGAEGSAARAPAWLARARACRPRALLHRARDVVEGRRAWSGSSDSRRARGRRAGQVPLRVARARPPRWRGSSSPRASW